MRIPILTSLLALLLLPSRPVAAVSCGDGSRPPQRAREVERDGIRWTFDRRVVVGRYANGDPWVVGPVRIVAIAPQATIEHGRAVHGSMIDPDPTTEQQGYDGKLYGEGTLDRYDEARNVARGVSEKRPLRLAPGQSLISVESGKQTKDAPILLRAAVLTCVAKAPAADAFRPPYVACDERDKQHRFRVKDLDFDALRRLAPTRGMPDIDEVTQRFAGLWLDHVPTWIVRHVHPKHNMPDYGRDIAALVGSAGVLLNTDLPDRAKKELLIRFVQFGIDSHAILRRGGRWKGVGGHGHGRKLPILVAGAVLRDERMLAIGADYVSKPKCAGGIGAYFAEDGQTFFVAETSPGVCNWGHGGYTMEQVGLPEWGFKHCEDPSLDDARWEGNDYRRCCTANAWLGQCLTARVMGLVEAWNHRPFFDYVDRYQQHEHTDAWHRSWVDWHVAMWRQYRPKY